MTEPIDPIAFYSGGKPHAITFLHNLLTAPPELTAPQVDEVMAVIENSRTLRDGNLDYFAHVIVGQDLVEAHAILTDPAVTEAVLEDATTRRDNSGVGVIAAARA